MKMKIVVGQKYFKIFEQILALGKNLNLFGVKSSQCASD
jgi:hypothetical protein